MKFTTTACLARRWSRALCSNDAACPDYCGISSTTGHSTDNVTTASMGYDRKNYSPLAQIDRSNVKRLVPVWSTSLMNDAANSGRRCL
jgi:glucose dehydrogenase